MYYCKSALFQNRSKYDQLNDDRTVLLKILNFREINWHDWIYRNNPTVLYNDGIFGSWKVIQSRNRSIKVQLVTDGDDDDDDENKSRVFPKYSFRCSRNVLCLSATYFFNQTSIVFPAQHAIQKPCTRVGTLIVATIYLQLIQNKYMFRSFTVLHCSHQHCVQPVASDVEVVGYL